MELLPGLIIAVVTFVAGIFVGKVIAPDSKRIKELETALAENNQQQLSYKNKVAEHFSESAHLFSDITDKYRSLYEHMSSAALDLCDRRNLPRELAASHVNLLAVESPEAAAKLNNHGVPIIEQGSIDELDVAKPKRKNSKVPKPNNESIVNTADIIDLDSQRSNTTEPTLQQAKDYAIKAKGVINHNSLNRDDVKT